MSSDSGDSVDSAHLPSTSFSASARPPAVDPWSHLKDNKDCSDAGRECAVHAIHGKIMDEGGAVKWVCEWDNGVKTKNDDADMDGCTGELDSQTGIWQNGLVEEFEAQHDPSSKNVDTIFEEVFQQSPFASASETNHELIVEVWRREKGSSAFKGYQFEDIRFFVCKAFAAMDPTLLSEIVGGNVQRRRYLNRNFRLMMDDLRNQDTDINGKRPCIYLFEFTDEFGLPPTKDEAKELLRFARKYITDWDFAWKTDQQFDPLAALDWARYRDEDYNKITQGSVERKRIVLDFIDRSEEYLQKYGLEYMLQAWREVGYAHDVEMRLSQHMDWSSSNYLMILMESISFAYFGRKWCNRAEMIFSCFDRRHAPIMEVVFTAISGAKIDSGHGMSHHPAGKSTRSNLYPRGVETWEKWEAAAVDNVVENVAIESEKIKRWREGVAEGQANAERQELLNRREELQAQVAIMKMEAEISAAFEALMLEHPLKEVQYNEEVAASQDSVMSG